MNGITNSNAVKGKRAEYASDEVIQHIVRWFDANGYPAYTVYNRNRGGRGRVGVDYFVIIKAIPFIHEFYIETKNWTSRRAINMTEFNDKILKKFQLIWNDHYDKRNQRYVLRHKLLIGHIELTEEMSVELARRGILYFDIGELKSEDDASLVQYVDQLTGWLMWYISYLCIDLKKLTKGYRIELLDKSNISVIESQGKSHSFNLSTMNRQKDFVFLTDYLLDFFYYSIGKRGLMKIQSPLRAFSRSPKIRYSNRKSGHTLWTIEWSEKG